MISTAGTCTPCLGACRAGEPVQPDCQVRDETSGLRSAAHLLGRQILFLNAGNEREIDTAFATMVQRQAGALLVLTDAFFISRRDQIAGLAAREAIPVMYPRREFLSAGGL